jgi:hypothetical protein
MGECNLVKPKDKAGKPKSGGPEDTEDTDNSAGANQDIGQA